ncbi:MAG: hypothetical protein WBW51_07405, partial [Methyloceanibacter sp.]
PGLVVAAGQIVIRLARTGPREATSVMVPRSVWLGILLAALFTLGATLASNLYPTAVLGSGFLAQLICSRIFV